MKDEFANTKHGSSVIIIEIKVCTSDNAHLVISSKQDNFNAEFP